MPLWRRTVKVQFLSVLAKRLGDYMAGTDAGCYPTPGRILLMQLMGAVFSVSDYTHGVITPMTLFCCECLTSCPVNTPRDVLSGLLICGVLLDYTAESGRFIPEVVLFLRTVLGAYYPMSKLRGKGASGIVSSRLGVINYKQLTGLRDALRDSQGVDASHTPWSVFRSSSNKWDISQHSAPAGAAISCSILTILLGLAGVVVQRHRDCVGFTELIYLLERDLRSLDLGSVPGISTPLLTAYVCLLEGIQEARQGGSSPGANVIKPAVKSRHSEDVVLNYRKPLQYRVQSTRTINTLVPRYEVNYSLSSRDPALPKEKVQLKVLGKQLKRESKAAMRELRRDADYLEQEKFTALAAKKQALREERHKNYAVLENEQGEINQQVKFGKGDLIKGGGSHAVKKRRV